MRLAIAGALAGALFFGGAPAGAQRQGSHVTEALDLRPGETLLEVESLGASRAVPDVLSLDIGVTSTGATAREAVAANTIKMNAVLAAIQQSGIGSIDMQTAQFRVEPQIDDENQNARRADTPRILGYVATNGIELRIRAFERASELLDALFAAGANDIANPSFSLMDNSAAIEAARREAATLAGEQAEAYAAAFDMRIARVIRISERSWRDGGRGPIIVTGSRIFYGVQLIPGEIETEVQLWVDYALVPQ